MKVKVFISVFVCLLLAGVAAKNVQLSLKSEKDLSELALANIKALANEENLENSESVMPAIYVRSTSDCVILGNGKISVLGGGILEVDGCLCLEDYQVSCSSGGTSTCKNIECAEIWGWVD